MNFSVRSSRVTGPEDVRCRLGSKLCIQQHCSVAVEFDERTVAATNTLRRANHHCTVNLAFFDAAHVERLP